MNTSAPAPAEIIEIRSSFGYLYAISAGGTRTKVGTDRGFGIAGSSTPVAPLRCDCGVHHRTGRDFLGHARTATCATFA